MLAVVSVCACVCPRVCLCVVFLYSSVQFLLFCRYDKRIRNTEKRMKELGLLGDPAYSLDEWELPRDRVVMNRKLGEGAFGAVYGGEAFVPDKGWIAVAVKTLKRGSKKEDKVSIIYF